MSVTPGKSYCWLHQPCLVLGSPFTVSNFSLVIDSAKRKTDRPLLISFIHSLLHWLFISPEDTCIQEDNASPIGSLQYHRGYNWDDYAVIAPLRAGTVLVKRIMKFWWVPERGSYKHHFCWPTFSIGMMPLGLMAQTWCFGLVGPTDSEALSLGALWRG